MGDISSSILLQMTNRNRNQSRGQRMNERKSTIVRNCACIVLLVHFYIERNTVKKTTGRRRIENVRPRISCNTYVDTRTYVTAYLIQFGNIMPIERINDYREDMKLSGPAGRVNCHYPTMLPTERSERERERSPRLSGGRSRSRILIINRSR